MADNIVGTKIVIDSSQAVQSVGSIKAQLREATQDLVTMSTKFGENSQEAISAAKKVAELRDRIGDAKSMVDAFNPDAKFRAVSQSVQGIAGAFAAVQGAMAAFGIESEDLQRQLLKVQGALALSEGLNTFLDTGIQGFKNLKTVAIDAFKGLKTAIGASGIGLLVVALGTIVAYWDDIKHAISGVSKSQEDLATKTKANVDAEKEKLDVLGSQDNTLKLQGKTENEILDIKIKQTNQVIKAMEAQLEAQIALENAQVKAAQRNKDILEGILKFISAPITLLLKGIDMAGKAFGKNFGLEEGFFGGIAKLVFDPAEVKTKGDEAIKETKKKLAELKETQAGYQLQIKENNKKASQDAAKDAEDRKKKFEDSKIELESIGTITNIATEKERNNYKDISKLKKQNIVLNTEVADSERLLAAEKRKATNEALDATSQSLSVLSDLLGTQTAEGKAAAIASAIISTYLSAQKAYESTVGIPIVGPVLAPINAALAVAGGIKSVKSIMAVQTPGGKSAGSQSMTTPSFGRGDAPVSPAPMQQTVTQLNQGTINALGNQAIKAYVLESDVTNSQNRVTRILNSSRFK